MSSMEIDDERPKLSAEADRELSRLWRTWRTVLEMLVDRVRPHTSSRWSHADRSVFQGYAISEEEVQISRDQFQRKFADPQTGYAEYATVIERPCTVADCWLEAQTHEATSRAYGRNDGATQASTIKTKTPSCQRRWHNLGRI